MSNEKHPLDTVEHIVTNSPITWYWKLLGEEDRYMSIRTYLFGAAVTAYESTVYAPHMRLVAIELQCLRDLADLVHEMSTEETSSW